MAGTQCPVRSSFVRLVCAGALILLGATCDDGGTEPHARSMPAHMLLVATISPIADVAIPRPDYVRATVYWGSDELVLDTTVAWPVGSFELALDLPVLRFRESDTFRADLHAYQNDGDAIYAASQTAQAVTVDAVAPPITIALSYVGPDVAISTIELSPRDPLFTAGDSIILSVVARLPDLSVVPATSTTWMSRDPSALKIDPTTGHGFAAGASTGVWVVATLASGQKDSTRAVVWPKIGRVEATPAALLLRPGGSSTLTAAVFDSMFAPLSGAYVQWRSTNEAVVTVGDAGNVSGVSQGTASIIATSYGKADTVPVKVTTQFLTIRNYGPNGYGGPNTLGMRQSFTLWVERSTSTGVPSTVYLRSSNPEIASVPATVVIPANQSSTRFDVAAHDIAAVATIEASTSDYLAANYDVRVTVPRLVIPPPGMPGEFGRQYPTGGYLTYGVGRTTVAAADESGIVHPVNQDVTLTFSSSAPNVVTLDVVSAVIPAGSSEVSVPLTLHSLGSSTITAVDPRTGASLSFSYSVLTPTLDFGSGDRYVGLGQTSASSMLNNYMTREPATVTVTRTDASANTTFPESFPLPPRNWTSLPVDGVSKGTDTLVASAPGFEPDTIIVHVDTGTIAVRVYDWPSTLRVGEMKQARIHVLNQLGGSAYSVLGQQFALISDGSVQFYREYQGYSQITSVESDVFFYVKGVSAGTTTVTVSNPNYRPLPLTITLTP